MRLRKTGITIETVVMIVGLLAIIFLIPLATVNIRKYLKESALVEKKI